MRILVPIATVLAGTLGLGAAELDLSGTWRLSTPSATNVWECAVPGDNASALLKAGFLRDPFWKGQEDCVQWLGNADWTFARTFDAEALVKRDLDRHYLEFDSIDTVADVVLNGVTLGSVANEFRAWRFDVTKVLRAKGNVLEVRVKAPRKEAEARWLRTPDYDIRSWAVTACREINCLRKCQCSFGWDWGCSLPVSGIYGGVRIVSCLQRLEQPWAESRLLDDGSAEITVHTGVSPVSSLGGVCTFNGETKRFRGDTAVFRLAKPELWWPNGMGAQKLYDWSVDFNGQVAKGRLGIRRLELVREKDAGGESFGFRVNGRDFFAAGADWIPCDAFPARRTPERIRALLRSAAEANVNCVRVWGGGTYESAAFYEACDELGLLVWQDFMFACGRYPATDGFLTEIAAEAGHQVKRLRQYTSILLWCGDNECIGGVREKGRYQDDWIKWNGVLAEAVAKNAPGTIWWPSSPCAGPGDFTYNELTGDKGDTHYWGVWHGSRDLSGYRMINPRFVSEFGYQSLPSAAMVERSGGVIHQKNRGGNEKIDRMLEKLFPEPKDFASRLYLSQVQQALAIETAVAYWRTLWPRCRGAVVWQLNDWWPVASWSSLEYDGRWKPLHYAMRRFFASGYDAKRRDAELRDLDFRTKDIPAANVRIASVTPRADGAFGVKVVCDARARFVWLEDPSDPGTRFDDNLVDLEAGERTFVCRPGDPTTAESLKSRLTVRDLSSSVKRTVKVCVTASETDGEPLPNLSSMAVAWDGRRLKWTPNGRHPVTNFVESVELMTATGGNAERDMDEGFKPLLDLCRKALDYGLKPYLKLGNVPVRFTAGCDPRRKKLGGADGGAYGLNIRPPDDYEAYGRHMRSCAAALRDAFGRDEVRSWRFSVLTEANNCGRDGDNGWFAAKGGDRAATKAAFLRLYDVTVKAFEAELGEGLAIGTHLLYPCQDDMVSFTYADVLAGCSPLRILPVSYYFGNPDGDLIEQAGQLPGLAEVMRAAGGRVVSGIDEGRICFSRPGAKSKDLRTRTVGQSYQAAFNVRMAKSVLDEGGSYIASWGFFAGEDPLFAGVPTFDYFTSREIAKFAGMRRCAARTDGTPPEKEAVDAIAAVSQDGRTVRVAVSRLRDKLEFADSFDTTVRIVLPAGLKAAGRLTVSELTLDDRNNWFVDWERERREKGIKDADYWASPDDPNPLFSLADDSAKAFFKSRMPAYDAKADQIVPRVASFPVPPDGVLSLPVSFRGNGAVFFELEN